MFMSLASASTLRNVYIVKSFLLALSVSCVEKVSLHIHNVILLRIKQGTAGSNSQISRLS